MAESIRIDQSQRSPLRALNGPHYGFRYAYDRSGDSINANTTGQDYIAINYGAKRLAFVLCDGVSQSFFGELAAQILGDALVGWLWEQGSAFLDSAKLFENELNLFLEQLTTPARQAVQDYELPEGLALMLPAVLEKKRILGSEATFTAGIIDLDSTRVLLAWMGDSRLRVWDHRGECTQELLGSDTFLTKERWSTHRGKVGSLHTAQLTTGDLSRLVTYSDGLACLDRKMGNTLIGSTSLAQVIDESSHLPGSDDLSYLEIILESNVRWDQPQPKAPEELTIMNNPRTQQIHVDWEKIQQADIYEIALTSSKGWRIFEVQDPFWSAKWQTLHDRELSIAVRSWSGGQVSPWSKRIEIVLPEETTSAPTREVSEPPTRELISPPSQLPAPLPLPVSDKIKQDFAKDLRKLRILVLIEAAILIILLLLIAFLNRSGSLIDVDDERLGTPLLIDITTPTPQTEQESIPLLQPTPTSLNTVPTEAAPFSSVEIRGWNTIPRYARMLKNSPFLGIGYAFYA